jgi:small subunit ribosomal protein S4
MARYTGPVCRLCRRHGEKLFLKGERCFTPKCSFDRRPNPPGPRPARRRKISDRGLQLREKQRARVTYGLLEKQFVRYYKEAIRRPGVSGENLVRLLEGRLDNVIYRLGFADSRNQARQIVQETIKSKNPPSWLSLDVANMTGRMTAPPTVVHGETHLFNENIIIEYYSR